MGFRLMLVYNLQEIQQHLILIILLTAYFSYILT